MCGPADWFAQAVFAFGRARLPVRKFFQILGVVALIIFLLPGAGIGWIVYQGITPDSESKTFLDAAVPAITAK